MNIENDPTLPARVVTQPSQSDKKEASLPPTETETVDMRRNAVPGERLWLVVSARAGVTCVPLPSGEVVTLGRSRTSDVRVEDDSVSRHHATFRVSSEGARTVEDAGSRNGTAVSGHWLAIGERRAVAPGAFVQLGSATVLLMRGPLAKPTTLSGSRSRLPSGEPLVLDPTMQSIYELLDVMASSSLSVLILGETGTGKEVFASELHARSPRSSAPFVKLNCATLSGSLLESELFGYEKGAFTGSAAAKPGLFEAAHGGTLFLDELGEVPVDTQAKLLRVIDSGEVLRLGSVTPRKVDVRYLSATNRDLHAAVSEGRFRSDLLFRLNGFEVTLPPLRERHGEILALARLFLERAGGREERPALTLGPKATDAILAHSWTGNIRELKTTIERGAAVAWHKRERTIEPEHLMIPPPPSTSPSEQLVPATSDGSLRRLLASEEKARVLDALFRAKGNQTKAAQLLGVSRRTIISKIEAFGIERPRKGTRSE